MHLSVTSLLQSHKALFGILLIAAVLRLFQLGTVPHGFTWDEAAIGYNGYAVITTRRDEWLTKLPVSFRSFGDYKAPFAIYLNGLFTTTLGMEQWVVRLPFALSGIAAVAVLYWLFCELGNYAGIAPRQYRVSAAVAAGILTLSPWHVLYSRTGFESGIALLFVLCMLVSLFRLISQNSARLVITWMISAVLFAVLSLYTYHSAKIAVPLLVLVFLAWQWRFFLQHWKASVLGGLLGGALLTPLVRDAVFGSGLERAGVSIFSQGLTLETGVLAVQQLLQHLSSQFLIFGETTTLRHGTGEWGVLLPTTFLFAALGVFGWVISLLKRRVRTAQKTQSDLSNFAWFFVILIGIGILPAAIATEVPHSNRSLLALPGFVGLAVLGVELLMQWAEPLHARVQNFSGQYVRYLIFGTAIFVHILLSVAFVRFYFTTYSVAATADFYDGYIEALSIAKEYEKGLNTKPQVGQIFVSSAYGQPYIYTLFVKKLNPIWYQGGSLSEKYTFLPELTMGDLSRENALLVASGASELPLEQATHVIYGADGSVRFKLYYLPTRSDDD